jgi:hypothetical protein
LETTFCLAAGRKKLGTEKVYVLERWERKEKFLYSLRREWINKLHNNIQKLISAKDSIIFLLFWQLSYEKN